MTATPLFGTTAPAAAPRTAPTPPAAPAKTKGFSGGDFETFLRMLTTQLKNQDPLNPMEGSEFAVQLATFSGVEQQTYTNKLLEQMAGQTGSGALMPLSNWIGKEARTTAPVQFRDRPLTLEVNPKPEADSVILVTKDSFGRDILREEIGPGKGQVEWFGRDAQGNKLRDGTYSFQIESWSKGTQIGTDPAPSFARVTGAESTPQGAKLILAGGSTILASEVEAIREAP